MLIDQATIQVRSGKGGQGCVSFRREKCLPRGGPDGGNGGDGGSVILVAEPGVDTLLDFKGRHHWYAKNGEQGRGKQQFGKGADDLEIKLPVGTLVYDDETGELILDLNKLNMRHVIAQGGEGGLGNEHFKSATNQIPKEFTPGGDFEEFTLRMELKLIADVGLVGLPNAGKSTFVSTVSKARPKIADYPFTTLEPNLGIAELPGSKSGSRRIIFADLPGLIEGAADGAGLGMKFLRHVERTSLLVHLLDTDPVDGSDPVENYHAIRKELEGYSSELAQKNEVIALSKMDLHATDEDRAAAVELFQSELGKPAFAISSATGTGINDLLEACWNRLDKHESAGSWMVD